MTRIAVLASGHGSNFQAILDAVEDGRLPGVEVALLVVNRQEAYAIRRAIAHGVPLVYFPLLPFRRAGRPRSEYDAALAAIVESFDVEWVVLAGWMHVLSDAFIRAFPARIVNLHPALPGCFPGTQAIQRAYEAFRRGEIAHTGVMVHLVPDEGVDVGPVVLQEAVTIYPDDSLDDLEGRIHAVEHRLLVEALRQLVGESEETTKETKGGASHGQHRAPD